MGRKMIMPEAMAHRRGCGPNEHGVSVDGWDRSSAHVMRLGSAALRARIGRGRIVYGGEGRRQEFGVGLTRWRDGTNRCGGNS